MNNQIAQIVGIAMRLVAAWLMAISMAACSPATPDPKPPLYVPIYLTRLGSFAEMEFWARPKDSHEKNVLMVSLRFKRNWSAPDQKIDYAYLAKLDAAKVRLHFTATQNGSPVDFKFYTDFNSEVQPGTVTGIGDAEIKARLWAHDGEYDYFYLAGLSRKAAGQYKIKLEVLDPNLDLEGMRAEVFVAFRLFGGK